MELISPGLQLLRDLEPQLTGLVNGNSTLFYVVLFAIIFARQAWYSHRSYLAIRCYSIVGVIAAKTGVISLPFLLILLIVAAVLGDAVNYAIGSKLGPAVFQYEKSWLLNKNHLLKKRKSFMSVMEPRPSFSRSLYRSCEPLLRSWLGSAE
ncbi:MAG UNVERIFIED_CONTAM: hypothetical protein LVR29_10795 [Microcystis novacekii LVE1205-3]|jgi:membrane-associated protein